MNTSIYTHVLLDLRSRHIVRTEGFDEAKELATEMVEGFVRATGWKEECVSMEPKSIDDPWRFVIKLEIEGFENSLTKDFIIKREQVGSPNEAWVIEGFLGTARNPHTGKKDSSYRLLLSSTPAYQDMRTAFLLHHWEGWARSIANGMADEFQKQMPQVSMPIEAVRTVPASV